VVLLIAQLDRPTEGALRISQQPMLDLERRLDRRMHEPPAPP
jgi:hypothetical protein